jgi:hypothetical protein
LAGRNHQNFGDYQTCTGQPSFTEGMAKAHNLKCSIKKLGLMKAATIQEIKQELKSLSPSELSEICLRLARFKKDNKELLTYLLFEASDETTYIDNVKKEIDGEFEELPKPNLYLTKKSLRKVLRNTTKQIRYAGSPQAEIELLTHFCQKIRSSKIPIKDSPVLTNLYRQQLKKLRAVIATMHEDLQYDYLRALTGLEV